MTTAAPAAAAAPSESAPATKPAATTPPAEKPAAKPAEKPAGEKPAESTPPPEAAPPEKPAAAAPVVPEKYELKIPDDAKEWLDEKDLPAISAIARGLELDNAGAQALIESHTATAAAMSEAFKTATETDTDYGGEHLEETRQLSKLALDTLRPAGTPRGDALRRILTRSGYGNHIEIVSLLADLGRGMREDHPVTGGKPSQGEPKTLAERIYPGKKA